MTERRSREQRAPGGRRAALEHPPSAAPSRGERALPGLRLAPHRGDPRDVPTQYGDWAATYDVDTASYRWSAPQRLLEALTRAAPPASWLRVLDVGVGTGQASAPYLEAGAQVTGLDIAPEMLSLARAKHPEFHHLEKYDINLSLSTAGIRPSAHDIVLSSGTLHFARDLETTLGDLARALTPGGVLAFTYIPPQNGRRFGASTNLHTPSEIKRLLRGLGLEVLHHAPFVAYYDQGNVQDPVTYALVVARDQRVDALLDLDRTASVDRKRILELLSAPLVEGPLETRWSSDDVSSENAKMLAALEAQMNRGGEIDPSSIPLPTSTAPESAGGRFGCDALGIFAHPDDETIFVGGTLKALTSEGLEVALALSTAGEGGRPDEGITDDLRAVRHRELSGALRVLGIDRLEILGLSDFGKYRDAHRSEPVTAADPLRMWGLRSTLEGVVRAIRKHRPRVLLSFEPLRDPNYSLHGHHLALGVASMLAFHLAADPHAFPEHFEEGLRPWAPLRHQVIVPSHSVSTRITSVPISVEHKLKALSQFSSQRYSTERTIEALRASLSASTRGRAAPGRTDVAEEKWHLLQARDGGPAGKMGVRAPNPLTRFLGAQPKTHERAIP